MKPLPKDANRSAAYRQIEESLRNRIRQGHWPVGTMLPSRRDLAREYGVSPITLERAVTHLLADGTLRADGGRGTFVVHVTDEERLVETPETPSMVVVDATPTHRATGNPRAGITPVTVGIIASLYLFNCDHLELNNYLVRTLLEAMEPALAADGMQTRFYNRVVAEGQPLLSLEQSLALTMADGVDAIVMIALGLAPEMVDESLAVLEPTAIPVVCITSSELRRPIPHVFYDNYSAGYQAAQHLLRAGHHTFLFLAPFTASWTQERFAGVRAAIEHAKLPNEAVWIYPENNHPWVNEEDPEVLGYEASCSALQEGLVPSAVICVNDGVAFGFVKAAKEAGKTLGTDVAVVGFDNHPRSFSLGITSLRAPMEAMGRETAGLLMREIHGEGAGFQVRLRWSLVPRGSTRASIRQAR